MMLASAVGCSSNTLPPTATAKSTTTHTAQSCATPLARTAMLQAMGCCDLSATTCTIIATPPPVFISNPTCTYNCDGAVATIPGAAPGGATCDSSPANDAVGTNNLPAGSNSWATTIGNVYGLEKAGSPEVYGWIFVTENQTPWFLRNASDTGLADLLGFLAKIPGLDVLANSLVNATISPYQLTGQQFQNIKGSLMNSGFQIHRCYDKSFSG